MPTIEQQVAELNDLVRGATQQSSKAIEELQAAVTEQVEKFAAMEQLRADVDALSEDFRKGIKSVLERTVTPAGDYRGMFGSREQARQFGLAVLGHCCNLESARRKLIDEGVEIKAMGEGADTAGGFLVPEEQMATIIRNVELYGVFRRRALVVPMSRDRQSWPKRAGGLTVYSPGEGTAITTSDVTIGQVALTAKKWCTLTAISSELEEDAAIAVAELVADEIALAFATKEDTCGFMGDGTSTYFGITGVLPHASTTDQAADSGDDTFAEAVAWKYLTGAIGQVPSWALRDASYYFHRTVFWANVVGQVDSNGVPIVKFVTTAGGPSGAPLQLGGVTPLLLGFPVELTEVLPSSTAVSTAFWAFGSLRRGWMLGDRRQIDVAQSREVYFATDQVGIRGTERLDIVASDATAMCKTTTAAS